MCKISVIITAYQDRGYIDECIQSAKYQVFDDYEIILASDGNADLHKYAVSHGIKFVLISKENHSALLNQAVLEAEGEWIKPIDDDDMITPNCLQDLWDAREGALVYANAMNFWEMNKQLYKSQPDVTFKDLLPIGFNKVHWATVLINRCDFLCSGGFDTKMNYSNDYDFYLSLLSKGYKFKYVDKLVAWYRLHPLQMSKTHKYYLTSEREYLKEKYKDAIYKVTKEKKG